VDAPKLKQVMPKFIEFCGSSLLVGHYVGLDMKFFNMAADKIFGSTIENPCIDTMYLAQAYTEKCWTQYHDQYNLQISYNLSDLSEAYNLPLFKQHDALHDALQTAYLFIFLVKKLQKHGLVTLRDFFQARSTLRKLF
jgi:DNA polymerase-3 subunit epsilon